MWRVISCDRVVEIGKEKIYLLPRDNNEFLEILGRVCVRYSWLCYSYCLMDNHYHLLIETPLGNLSQGMKYLNGCYTQYFNKMHKRVWPFICRVDIKVFLVEKDSYLLELSRYIVLNTVRALMGEEILDWPWSSYIHTVEANNNYPWLNTNELLSYFGNTISGAKKAYN